MKAWLKHIGSKKAHADRVEQRLALKLNKPRRVWGIAKWCRYLREEGIVRVKYKSDPTLPL